MSVRNPVVSSLIKPVKVSVTGSETVLIISEPMGVDARAATTPPGDKLPDESLPTACAVTATFCAESIDAKVLGTIFAKPLKTLGNSFTPV